MYNLGDKNEFRYKFFQLVEESENILITSHKNPDDDSISSVLSLYSILLDKYSDKKIRIIYASGSETRWSYFEHFEKIEFVESLDSFINEFDLIIELDLNQYIRAGINKEIYTGKTICMDHHSSAPDAFDLTMISQSAESGGCASNAELIYRVFLEDQESIKPGLAENILLGIMGDTGWLTFIRPDQTENFSIVKRLVDEGKIELQDFRSKFRGYSYKTLCVIKEFVKNLTLNEQHGWPNFLTSYVDRKFVEDNTLTDQELSEASGIFVATYLTSLTDAEWGASFYPIKNGSVKMSLRSRPSGVNVRAIGESLANGGGHNLASGGVFKEEGQVIDTLECIEKLINWLKNNTPTKL